MELKHHWVGESQQSTSHSPGKITFVMFECMCVCIKVFLFII